MGLRQQSAMEYLMTYGWSIPIVAIVIIALFQLGVFNNSNLSPHATSGACQAVHTAAGSSLAGQCNNELPQFVAQFNGQGGYIEITPFTWSYSSTISMWVNMASTSGQSANQILFYTYGLGGSGGCIKDLGVYTGNLFGYYYSTSSMSKPFSINNWYFITVEDDSTANKQYFYVDGVLAGSSSGVVTFPSGGGTYGSLYSIYLGFPTGSNTCSPYNTVWGPLNGYVSNLQIYNTSLSSSEISTLYQEGVGGVPVDPNHITGWWPLNGNANDYSGNNKNGQLTGISWNGTWTSGYVQP